MVEVQGVSKTYSTVKAVDSLSFRTTGSEIFGLIGPNGSGKSTTIRMIMNIIKPDSGQILFDGKPISNKDKDRIGYLPEERGLYKKMPIKEILQYFAALKGVSHKKAETSMDIWLERFQLSDWKTKKIETLSKGMAQRVQFIASVIHDPDIVFFDEPFSGLDPVSSEVLLAAMSDLSKAGKTVFFSTHIMEHAEKICSKILLINKGKEVVSGNLSEVKARYGKNAVHLEFDGDGDFIKRLPFIDSVVEYPRYLEAQLKADASADDLFQAIAGKISVKKFELASPSLHKIFINLVGTPETETEHE